MNFWLLISLAYLYLVIFLIQSGSSLGKLITVCYFAVLSNLADRVRLGAVVDFIQVHFWNYRFFLNFADLFQQFAVMGIFYSLVRMRGKNGGFTEKRGNILIDPQAQLNGAWFFSTAAFLVCIGAACLVYAYFDASNATLGINKGEFAVFVVLTGLFVSTLIFFCSIFYSLRLVGPVFALKKYFENYDPKKADTFRLREGDYFRYLEKPVNDALVRATLDKRSGEESRIALPYR